MRILVLLGHSPAQKQFIAENSTVIAVDADRDISGPAKVVDRAIRHLHDQDRDIAILSSADIALLAMQKRVAQTSVWAKEGGDDISDGYHISSEEVIVVFFRRDERREYVNIGEDGLLINPSPALDTFLREGYTEARAHGSALSMLKRK